jgi:hypothetical protein
MAGRASSATCAVDWTAPPKAIAFLARAGVNVARCSPSLSLADLLERVLAHGNA